MINVKSVIIFDSVWKVAATMNNEIILLDKKYKNWISDIGVRFKRSQIKAASKVNEEMLLFYWELGRDIEFIKPQNLYGSNLYQM